MESDFCKKNVGTTQMLTVHHHPLEPMNKPYRLSVQKGHPIPSFAGGDHLSSGNLIQRGLNGMAVVKLRLQCC